MNVMPIVNIGDKFILNDNKTIIQVNEIDYRDNTFNCILRLKGKKNTDFWWWCLYTLNFYNMDDDFKLGIIDPNYEDYKYNIKYKLPPLKDKLNLI